MPRKREPASPYAVLFANTVTARMLRLMLLAGTMPQAEFMREYHRRCERAKPSRSSFGMNFGRYAWWWARKSGTVWIDQCKRGASGVLTAFRGGAGFYSLKLPIVLAWCGPDIGTILGSLTDHALHAAYESLEYQFQHPRASDPEDEILSWVHLIAAEKQFRYQRAERRAA